MWKVVYKENKVNDKINNIDFDITKDAKGYANKYINIVTDKYF